MGEVVDMWAARRRRDKKKLQEQIDKTDKASQKRRSNNKLAEALAKWGNLNGNKSLERMKKLFKKETDDELEPGTDQPSDRT